MYITGVAEGMATITVTASDCRFRRTADAMQTIMVTVMMMPPMELGDPSITNVMSDADGMATVMLMPGDNATKHWIWALPTDRVSEGMWLRRGRRRRHHPHHLWPDQRHELLVHRHRRSR